MNKKLIENYKESYEYAVILICDYVLDGLTDRNCTPSQHVSNKKIAYFVCEGVIGCNRKSFKNITGLSIDYNKMSIKKEYANLVIKKYIKEAIEILKEKGLWVNIKK